MQTASKGVQSTVEPARWPGNLGDLLAAIAAGRNGEDPKASLKMESKPSFLERCGLHSRHEHS